MTGVIAVWLPAAIATIACLLSALAVATRLRPSPATNPTTATGLSVIVPVRGADERTEGILDRLVSSRLPVPVEYLVALESTDDPAHGPAQRVRGRHPDVAMSIVVTGPAGDRMGKQHNLSVAAQQARYDTIASMDADVQVEPDTLATGLAHLVEGVGVAYFLPRYRGPGPVGGRLVALYSNYYYQLHMAALALRGNAPFITGGLWLMSAPARRRLGGLDQFAATVSDDAAIGRAVVAAGLRNHLIPRTVDIAYERLDLSGGARHVGKWLTLLRAEGLPVYLAIALTWHPILFAAAGTLASVALGGPIAWAAGLLAGAVTVRLGAGLVLHRRAYGPQDRADIAWLPLYELLAVPVLFGRALFSRRIDWRGTRYTVGRGGRIRSAAPAEWPSLPQKRGRGA